jgi:hypothetical protein
LGPHFFDEPIIVVEAELRLYADIVQITPPGPAAVHRVNTSGWRSSRPPGTNASPG